MTTTLDYKIPQQQQPSQPTRARQRSLFDPEILLPAIMESFKKLNPVHMVRNPVMFVTEVGAAVTTVELYFAREHHEPFGFVLQICLWLWFTVLFANFAEAMAEGRGKAQADALRKSRTKTSANKLARRERFKLFRQRHCARATFLLSRPMNSSLPTVKLSKAPRP